MTGRTRLLGAALALALAGLALLPGWRSGMAAPQPDAARAFVQDVGNQVLGILEDEALSEPEQFARLVETLEGPIDLDLVARLILGRHWRTADEAQRERYLELFRTYALETLASKLHLYQGQEFAITDARTVGERDALVTTRITSQGAAPLKVDWRLREQDGGLTTIDVIVEGVSLIVSMRSEFGSVIERQGMEGLLSELEQRIAATKA